jgi:hypothetical protein
MNNPVNRRALLKGVATGAVAVGFSQAAGGWLTAASASGRSGVSLAPSLDGVLETAPEVLTNFSSDFGNLVNRGTPRAVLRPGSVDDIVKVVRFARSNRLKVAMNGRAAPAPTAVASTARQPSGRHLDRRPGLSQIHRVDSGCALLDAG